MEPFESGKDAKGDRRLYLGSQAARHARNGDGPVRGARELQPGVCAENILENAVACVAGCRVRHGELGELGVSEETGSFWAKTGVVSEINNKRKRRARTCSTAIGSRCKYRGHTPNTSGQR